MVTVKSTTDVTLNTPAEIVAYLKEQRTGDRFKPGDVVRVTDRASLPNSVMTGDVGIVIGYDTPGAPFTSVRYLTTNGTVTSGLIESTKLELYTEENTDNG